MVKNATFLKEFNNEFIDYMKFNLLACIMYGSEFFQDAVYYKYSSALSKAIY